MLLVFTAAMVVALMMVAMALPALASGGDDNEDNQSASSGSTRNGQIVFRRYFDPDQTKGALFTMTPDGLAVTKIGGPGPDTLREVTETTTSSARAATTYSSPCVAKTTSLAVRARMWSRAAIRLAPWAATRTCGEVPVTMEFSAAMAQTTW